MSRDIDFVVSNYENFKKIIRPPLISSSKAQQSKPVKQ